MCLMACARPPTSPDPTRNTAPELKLVGPDSLWPGEAAQFSMVEVLADGTSTDVTSQASWTATPPGVLSTSSTGLVSGRVAGVGTLSAEYRGTVLRRTIAVKKELGTYLLRGYVTSGGVNVPGVRLEALSGPLTGKVATTNTFGEFRFYGVAGNHVDLRWSKEGYLERTQRVSMEKHPLVDDYQIVYLTLDTLRAPMEVAGSYTMTVNGERCDAGLPPELRTRVYSATIQQAGPRVNLILGGADFGNNRTSGIAEPDSITIDMNRVTEFSDGIAERVGPNLWLSFGVKLLTLTAGPGGLSGRHEGGIHLSYETPVFIDGKWTYLAGSCQSADVSFVRR